MDLEQENRRLRQRLQALTYEARNSEAVARRCHERELQIVDAEACAVGRRPQEGPSPALVRWASEPASEPVEQRYR